MSKVMKYLVVVMLLLALIGSSGCCCVFARRGVLFPNPSLGGNRITGVGAKSTRTFEFNQDFSGVEAGGVWDIDIIQGDSYSVEITTNDNLFDYLDVQVSGNVLRLDLRNGYSFNNLTLDAEITMPELQSLELSGSAEAELEGEWQAGVVRLGLSGASRIDAGTIAAATLDIRTSGSSRVQLAGSAEKLNLQGSGASRFDMKAFSASDADIRLSGSSRATLAVRDTLDVSLSGASRVTYSGNPSLGRANTSGSSRLERQN